MKFKDYIEITVKALKTMECQCCFKRFKDDDEICQDEVGRFMHTNCVREYYKLQTIKGQH